MQVIQLPRGEETLHPQASSFSTVPTLVCHEPIALNSTVLDILFSEDNIGSTGALRPDADWDYYELTTETAVCPPELQCPNGKCLTESQVCDGKDDCGDKHDESACRQRPDLRLRLVGGRSRAEGRLEVKAFDYPWGGVCDDGFGLEEANVVCRQLGFPLGAKEALINSHFGSGDGDILLDELSCQGNEDGLLQCQFSPWTEHDCSVKEWAGVVCKERQEECHTEEVGFSI